MAIEIRNLSVVMGNLSYYVQGSREQAYMAAREIAEMLQYAAKTEHPWNDDTFMTRITTKGSIMEQTEDHVLITLSAGMYYDVYLELSREGKWAWIWPTVMKKQPEIMKILEKWLYNIRMTGTRT